MVFCFQFVLHVLQRSYCFGVVNLLAYARNEITMLTMKLRFNMLDQTFGILWGCRSYHLIILALVVILFYAKYAIWAVATKAPSRTENVPLTKSDGRQVCEAALLFLGTGMRLSTTSLTLDIWLLFSMAPRNCGSGLLIIKIFVMCCAMVARDGFKSFWNGTFLVYNYPYF